jgi:radical SAM superfamily enzyme YgiQ (UPF0313 family)
MKILLISPNRLRTPYPVYALGVDHVASALAGRHVVQILDLCPQLEPDEISRAVKDFEPDLVGLSLRNIDNTDATNSRWFVSEYRGIMEEIRRATKAPVVLGGAGFTVCSTELMEILGADWGIAGEGERLVELADQLESGHDPVVLPGLVHAGGDLAKIEPWPGPFLSGQVRDTRVTDFYVKNGGILNIQTKRGCPYECTYCTYPSIEGHKLRCFPAREVGRTARRLQDAGARFLFITDATFNCHPKHNLAVARAFQEAGLTIPWGAFFTPLPMADGYYEELVAAGLSHVEFGTEALTEETLAGFAKPFKVGQVFEAHQQAQRAGAHVAHYFMPGGPDETPGTLQRTLENVDRLDNCVNFFFCGVRIYPGTRLYERALAEGQVAPGQSLLEPIFYRSPAMEDVNLEALVSAHARRRMNWILGSGGARIERTVAMMYKQGHSGPLWEKLIR